MIGNLMHKGALQLPEIRSVVPSTGAVLKFLKTQHGTYAASVSAAAIAIAFSGTMFVVHERHLGEQQAVASRVESANIDLQDELARLRDQAETASRDLAAAQSRVAALTEEVQTRTQAA